MWNGYWEVHRRFQGDFLAGMGLRGGGFAWEREELSMEEFVMGKENSHEGGAGFFSIFF